MKNRTLRLRILQLYDTQADFAQDLGVTDGVVSRILNGRRQLSDEQAQQWADLLQMPVVALQRIAGEPAADVIGVGADLGVQDADAS